MDDFRFVDSTTSTNKELAALLNGSVNEGFIVQTNYQTQGKGQAGNYWESEAGKNLLFSMVLYPEFLPPIKQFLISKATSVAIVKVLNGLKNGFEIKWPNDIYFQNKKLAGILIETAIMGSQMKHAIIGIGLNVNQEVFQKAPNPISLKQILGKELDVTHLLKSIKSSILNEYKTLKSGDIHQINSEYSKYLFRSKGLWKFKDANGVFEASVSHVKENGLLVLKTTQGTTSEYWMKEVEFLF